MEGAEMSDPKDTYKGTSSGGFKAATEAAVAVYKERNGPPTERVKLKVEEMYVMVENPIRDYHVVLSASS
jgi:hypothetical protein